MKGVLRCPHANHTTQTPLLLIILVTIAATLGTMPAAHSATIPLGTIHVANDPIACGSSFYTSWCFGGTITTCPSTDSIDVTIGYADPTQRSTPLGTIVLFGGGSGTMPASPGENVQSYLDNYVKNYTIVQVAWASAWEKATASGTQNILLAACRPATLLKWINDSAVVHSAGAMCAQGKSAGSAAIAYAMSWYGADSYLKNVELLAGPVLSRMDDGCNPNPPTVTMCPSGGVCTAGTISWSRNAGYTADKAGDINSWGGVSNCTSTINTTQLEALQDMSIVDGEYTGVTPKFSFSTKRHGWICARDNTNYDNYATDCPNNNAFCPNNSSPQGYDWYAAASDRNLKVSGTNKCDGTTTSMTSTEAEGVEGTNALDPDLGTSEKAQIETDMNNNCL